MSLPSTGGGVPLPQSKGTTSGRGEGGETVGIVAVQGNIVQGRRPQQPLAVLRRFLHTTQLAIPRVPSPTLFLFLFFFLFRFIVLFFYFVFFL